MKMSSLLEDYKNYLAMPKNLDRIYLSDISLAPASLLPSLHFAEFSSIPLILPSDTNVRNHLERILCLSGDIKLLPNEFPFIRFPFKGTEEDKVDNLGFLDHMIWRFLFDKENDYEQYGGVNTFRYVLGEILSNVDQNSEANVVSVYSQTYSKRKFIDIGILDNGVTIPGRYEQSKPEFANKNINPYEFENDCEALYKAMNGISTKEGFKRAMEGISSYKDIYLNDWIGYGLNTSIRLITEGLGGSFLIASRGGICHLTKKEKKFIKAKGDNILNGTLVCIRFKRAKLKKDFMDYIMCHSPIKGPF
jgi:hypothetical protein